MLTPSRRTLLIGVAATSAAPAGACEVAKRGAASEPFQIDRIVDLARVRVPSGIDGLQSSGYSVAGLGGARYLREPDQLSVRGSRWRLQDRAGGWWVLAEARPTYEMFGARADPRGRGDREALQAANDYAVFAGIPEVHATPAAVYQTDREVKAGRGVANLLNGATIHAVLMHPDDAALSVRSGSSWRDGRIIVESGVTPGAQANCHAGVRAGPIIGRSRSNRAIDPQEGIKGWLLQDLLIETRAWSVETGTGKVAVQITGGTSEWTVRRVSAPDSALMAGLIHADWAAVGPVVSADALQSANREAYRAVPRAGWTTHPHNGVIEDCHGGRFSAPVTETDTGSDGIRLSGCHDVLVRNCSMLASTYAALRIVAGDLGFEFALPEQRARAHKGLVVESFRVEDAREGYACWIDLKADNVQRAVQAGDYTEMTSTVPETDIIVRSLTGSTRTGRNSGLRLNNFTGGEFVDCVLSGFGDGIQIDEGVSQAKLIRPVTRNSQRHGGLVDHARVRPSDVLVEQPVAERSGRATVGAHWLFGNCDRCSLVGGTLGAPLNETATWGIVLAQGGAENRIAGQPRIAVRPGGQPILRQ